MLSRKSSGSQEARNNLGAEKVSLGIDGGLPIGVAGTASINRAATFAPARCSRAENLDFGHHPVAQFRPELIEEAGAEEPQLRGPGC